MRPVRKRREVAEETGGRAFLATDGDADRHAYADVYGDANLHQHAHGHLHGSQVIKEVAATIRQSLAPPAYVVAYAGDEFVVVLPDCGLDQAEVKALDIQQHIRDAVYLRQQGLQVQVKASMGVAVYPWQARDAGELLAFADQAMFTMNAWGKDDVRTYR